MLLNVTLAGFLDNAYDGQGHSIELFAVELSAPIGCELGSRTLTRVDLLDLQGLGGG